MNLNGWTKRKRGKGSRGIESWEEMAGRTQKMSFICNLGKGIRLRRERSDVLWAAGRGTVAALLMSSLFSDVAVRSARNESAKGSRWLLSLSKTGAGCQKTARCCCSEEFGPLRVVLLVACSGLAAAGGEPDREALRGWGGGEVGLFGDFVAEKSS